jgi:hypothetical protein
MKTTLEKQLQDKCKEIGIDLDIEHDRIRIDLPATKVFNTTGTHWEYCVIPTASDLRLGRDEKYNYNKERNDSIRIMLEAIETIYELADGEKCGNQDECEECYG